MRHRLAGFLTLTFVVIGAAVASDVLAPRILLSSEVGLAAQTPSNVAFSAVMIPNKGQSDLMTGIQAYLQVSAARVNIFASVDVINTADEPTIRLDFVFTPPTNQTGNSSTSAPNDAHESQSTLNYYMLNCDGSLLTRYFGVGVLYNNLTSGYRPTSGWNVSILNGTQSTNGVVVLQPRGQPSSPPGYVCSYGIDATAATAICRAAGFTNTTSATLLHRFGRHKLPPAGPIYMSSVDCDIYPLPSIIDECTYSYNDTTASGCTGEDAVGVNCNPGPLAFTLGGNAPRIGRLFARNASTGEIERGVCLAPALASNPAVANHLCADMGLSTSHAQVLTNFGLGVTSPTTTPTLYYCSTVAANGHLNCAEIPPTPFQCTAGTTVGLDCREKNSVALDTATASIMPVSGDADAGVGLLVVTVESTSGSVCTGSFTNADATRFCRAAGLNVSYGLMIPNIFGAGEDPQETPVLTALNCSAAVGNTSLSGCSAVLAPAGSQWVPCQPFEAVGIDCRDIPPTSNAPIIMWEAMVNISSPLANGVDFVAALASYLDVDASRVELHFSLNSGPYQDNFFTFTDPPRDQWYTAPSREDLDYAMGRISRSGTLYYLDMLALFSNSSESRPGDTAQFLATIVQPANWTQITNATFTAAAGLLLVRPNASAPWGTVCSLPNFGTMDATAACNSAFAVRNISVAYGAYLSTAPVWWPANTLPNVLSSPIYISNVQCGAANTQNIFDCDFTYSAPEALSPQHDCTHLNDVFVSCTLAGTTPPLGSTIFNVTTDAHVTFPLVQERIAAAVGVPVNTVQLAAAPTAAATGGDLYVIYFRDPNPAVSRTLSINANFNLEYASGIPGVVSIVPTYPAAPVAPASASWVAQLQAVANVTAGMLLTVAWNSTGGMSTAGTVCSIGFSQRDALYACQAVGQDTPTPRYSNSPAVALQVSPTTPIYLSEVACSRSSVSFFNCSSLYSPPGWPRSGCTHASDVLLNCSDTSFRHNITGWQFRLSNMTAKRGLVEVNQHPNSTSGSWGTICDDGFGIDDAIGVCRAAGFNVSFAYPLFNFAQGNGTVDIDMVNCTQAAANWPTNYTIRDCNFLTVSECSHRQDVAVDCTGVAPQSTDPVVLYTATANASTTDPIGITNALAGFFAISSARINLWSIPPLPTSPPGTLDVQFVFLDPSPLKFFTEVSRATLDAQMQTIPVATLYAQFAILHISFNSSTGYRPTSWQFSLDPGTRNVTQQIPLSQHGAGRLLGRPNQTAPWGTVCMSGFDSQAILAACHSLGFADATTPVLDFNLMNLFAGTPYTAPIYLTDVSCGASAQFLQNCSYLFHSTQNAAEFGFCDHAHDVWVRCYPTGLPASSFSYSIASTSASPRVGLLQVKPQPSLPWGTVCDDGFSATDATVACRGLSMDAGAQGGRWSSGQFSTLTSPIYMDEVSCGGTESSLAQCQFLYSSPAKSYHDCLHYEDVIVDCREPNVTNPASWSFHITALNNESNPDAGRVDFRPSANMPWGTICSVGFDTGDAGFVCRTLGYNVSFGMAIPWYGEVVVSTGFQFLSQVNCSQATGNTLQTCKYAYSVPGNSWLDGCSTSTVLGIDCSGVIPQSGAPVVMWEVVINSSMTAQAFQASLAAYFSISPSRILVLDWQPGVSQETASFVFLNPAPSQAYVQYGRGDLDYFFGTMPLSILQQAFSIVAATSNATQNQRPPGLTARILPGNASNAVGLLQVRPDLQSPWGTVCSDGFGPNEMRAACQSAGFVPSAPSLVPATGGSGPIYLSNVQCAAGAEYIQNCSYTYSSATENNSPSSCTHGTDVALDCRDWRTINWQFRLARNATRSGEVQLRPDNQSDWGTICGGSFGIFDEPFSDQSALVVCHSLGFRNLTAASVVVSMDTLVNPLTGPIYVTGVDCSATANYFQNCSYTFFDNIRNFPKLCTHFQDVSVDCSQVDPAQWLLSLDNSTSGNPAIGLLRIQRDSDFPYEGICSSGFTDVDALVACRQLGYNVSTAQAIGLYGGMNGQAFLSGVDCPANATRLQQCAYQTTPFNALVPACRASQFVGVDCRGVPRGPLPIVVFSAAVPTLEADNFALVVSTVLGCDPSQVVVLSNQPAVNQSGLSVVVWEYAPPDTGSYVQATLTSYLPEMLQFQNVTSNISAAVKQTMRLRLVSDHGLNPPANSTTLRKGLLEVQPFPDAAWGTICDDGVGTREAVAMCRSLGFVVPTASIYFGANTTLTSRLNIFIDSSDCSTASGPYFQNCSFLYSDPAWQRPLHDCINAEDVYLDCSATLPSEPQVQFQIVPTPALQSPLVGALQARTRTSGGNWTSWGGVCGPMDSLVAATAVCASMGLATPAGRFTSLPGTLVPPASWSVTGVSCTAPSLANCTVVSDPVRAATCDAYSQVGIDCRNLTAMQAYVNSSSTGVAGRGVLQVRYNATSTWGSVCTDGFDDNAALAACHTAGINVATAYSLGWWGGGIGPVLMTNVLCSPNATTSLAQCGFMSMPTSCEHWEDVAVDCTGRPRPVLPVVAFTATVANATSAIATLARLLVIPPSRLVVISSTPVSPGGSNISFVVGSQVNGTSGSWDRFSIENTMLGFDRGELQALGLNNFTSNVSNAVRATMTVTLIQNATNASGIVAVRPSSSYGLGTVCNDDLSFGPNEVAATCRTLGFAGGVAVSPNAFGLASGPIYLSDVACSANASNLRACQFTFTTPDNPRRRCDHTQDVAVRCFATPATPSPPSTSTPAPSTTTATPAPSNTATPAPSDTATPASSNTATPTPSNTATPAPSNTATPTPSDTATPAPSNTATPTPSNTATAAPTTNAATPAPGTSTPTVSQVFTATILDPNTFNADAFAAQLQADLGLSGPVSAKVTGDSVTFTIYGESDIAKVTAAENSVADDQQWGIKDLHAAAQDPPTEPSSDKPGLSLTTIILIAVGSALVLGIGIVAVLVIRKRRRTPISQDPGFMIQEGDDYVAMSDRAATDV
jgi:hypothetical protein